MSNEKETAQERMARMKREREAAKKAGDSQIVEQLTNESTGEPDFSEIAKKLKARKKQETKGENDGYTKMTIYIRDDIAESFNALITKRGQQKEFANQALSDFVSKKIRELGL